LLCDIVYLIYHRQRHFIPEAILEVTKSGTLLSYYTHLHYYIVVIGVVKPEAAIVGYLGERQIARDHVDSFFLGLSSHFGQHVGW
jgi:hypothetical protein